MFDVVICCYVFVTVLSSLMNLKMASHIFSVSLFYF